MDIVELLFTQPITRIDSSCFERSEIKSITIPSSVIEIGDRAFGECSDLKSIIISSSVKRIGKSCFINCTDLCDVVLKAQITEIESCFFKELFHF